MKIKIVDLVWDVEKVPAHDPALMVDGSECFGTTWIGHLKICVNAGLVGDRARRTILHELCHAYIWSTQAIRPETWDEEAVCDFMAIYGPQMAKVADKVFEALYLVDVDLVG